MSMLRKQQEQRSEEDMIGGSKPKAYATYRFAKPHQAVSSHRAIEVSLLQAKAGVPIEEKLRKITMNANLNLTKRKPKKSDPELAFNRHLDQTIDSMSCYSIGSLRKRIGTAQA